MNKDSQHKSTEAQQWPPISFEKHVWQQDDNQDATERIEEGVVKVLEIVDQVHSA